MASPLFRMNGAQPGSKLSLAADTTLTATIDNLDGVNFVEWSIASTDEESSPDDYTLVTSGSKNESVQFVVLGLGTAGLLRSTVNHGVDPRTGNFSTAMSTTAKFFVETESGFEVGTAGEQLESDPTFGSTGITNAVVREVDAFASSAASAQGTHAPVKAATTGALPTNNYDDSAKTITAGTNGAWSSTNSDSVSMSPGDRFLVKDEPSGLKNGLFVFTNLGSGGAPWVLTRAADANTSGLVQASMQVSVQSGTQVGMWILATPSPITLGTTPLRFIKQQSEYDVRLFGAVPDGVTDSGAAILAALAALPATGGKLLFPPGAGDYLSSVPIDFSGLRSVQLIGHGSATGGARTASVLNYTGTGAKFLDFKASVGCGIEGLQVLYNNNAFAGVLVSLDSLLASPASVFTLAKCFLGGDGHNGAEALLAVENTFNIAIRDTNFGDGQFGLRGQSDVASTFCNTLTMTGGGFGQGSLVLANVVNPGQAWTFTGVSFESLASGAANSIQARIECSSGVTIQGCWMGDVSAGGQHLTILGLCWHIAGTYFGGDASSTAIQFGYATTIAAGSDGVSLPTGTIHVADASGFAASGSSINVVTDSGVQTVAYTGTSGTTFTGCTGGAGTMHTGGKVGFLAAVGASIHDNQFASHHVGIAFADAGVSNTAIQTWGNRYDSVTTPISGSPVSGFVEDDLGTRTHYAGSLSHVFVQSGLARMSVDSVIAPHVPIQWPDGLSGGNYSIRPAASGTTVGNSLVAQAGDGAAGFRGGTGIYGGGAADAGSGSPTHLAGDTRIELGIPVGAGTGVSAALDIFAGASVGSGGRILTVNYNNGSVVFEATGIALVLAADTSVTLEALGGDLTIASSAEVRIGSTGGGHVHLGADGDTTHTNVRINGSAATTVGAAGAGSALPATPAGYLVVNINGTDQKIPYYAL